MRQEPTTPEETSSTQGYTSRIFTFKTAAGIVTLTVLIFLSRPIVAYLSREACYSYYGHDAFWANPLKSMAKSLISTYQCEWIGHYGFQWHEVLSFLSNSWSTVAGALGSGFGFYALGRKMRGSEPEMPAATRTESPPEPQLDQLLDAIDKGYLPLKTMTSARDKNQTTDQVQSLAPCRARRM